VGIICWIFVDEIAHLTNSNSTPQVTEQVKTCFLVLVLASPAFGFMLLVDGFYKSNGDATTPAVLEGVSLGLKELCNCLFILVFDWGIAGAGYACALSRLVPAAYGGYRLHFSARARRMVFLVNTCMNLARIPLTILALYGTMDFATLAGRGVRKQRRQSRQTRHRDNSRCW